MKKAMVCMFLAAVLALMPTVAFANEAQIVPDPSGAFEWISASGEFTFRQVNAIPVPDFGEVQSSFLNPVGDIDFSIERGAGDVGPRREFLGSPAMPYSAKQAWQVLDEMNAEQRAATTIEVEIGDNLPAEVDARIASIQADWRAGGYQQAISKVRDLGNEGYSVALGLSYVNAEGDIAATFPDVRIGVEAPVYDYVLDFYGGNGAVYAVLHYQRESNNYWGVYRSANNGISWTRTYEWFSAPPIRSIGAVVVDDYLYVAYVSEADPQDARIRRLSANAGAIDGSYGFQNVVSGGANIVEVQVASNLDTFDNRLYYSTILADGSLIFNWTDEQGNDGGLAWTQIATGVTTAVAGLDAAWNTGFQTTLDWYLFISYISETDTGYEVNVARVGNAAIEENTVEPEWSGWYRTTSVAARDGNAIVVYENDYNGSNGIKYWVSYSTGDTWFFGAVGTAGEQFAGLYHPEVTGRGDMGFTCVYHADLLAAALDSVFITNREYGQLPWSPRYRVNYYDPATAYPVEVEYLPTPGNIQDAYGVIYDSGTNDEHPTFAALFTRGGKSCPLDFDNNGSVGPGDVGLIKNNFGCNVNILSCQIYDLDSNGAVGPGDVGIVKNNFGACP